MMISRFWRRLTLSTKYIRYQSTLSTKHTEYVLEACTKTVDVHGAVQHYNNYIKSGMKPTVQMLTLMLSLATELRSLDAAYTIWQTVQFMNHKPTAELYYLMMKTFAEQRDGPEAWKMFLDLSGRNIDFYNAGLKGLIEFGSRENILKLLKEMDQVVGLNEETLEIVLTWFLRNREYDRIIKWYHTFQSAPVHSMDSFQSSNVGPKSGQVDRMEDGASLWGDHVNPREDAECIWGDPEFSTLMGKRFVLNDKIYSLVVDAYCLSRTAKRITWEFIEGLLDSGKVGQQFFSLVIRRMALELREWETMRLFQMAGKYYFENTRDTYNNIARMYIRLEGFQKGLDWMNKMERMGWEVSAAVVTAMVRAWFKAKKYDEAFDMTKKLLMNEHRLTLPMTVDVTLVLCDLKYLVDAAKATTIKEEEMEWLLDQLWEMYQPYRKTKKAGPIRIYKKLLDHYSSTNQLEKAEVVFKALLNDSLYLPTEEGIKFGHLFVKNRGWEKLYSLWQEHTFQKTKEQFEQKMITVKDLQLLKADMFLKEEMFESLVSGFSKRSVDPKVEQYVLEMQYAVTLEALHEEYGIPKWNTVHQHAHYRILDPWLLTGKSLCMAWKHAKNTDFKYKEQFSSVLKRLCELLGHHEAKTEIIQSWRTKKKEISKIVD